MCKVLFCLTNNSPSFVMTWILYKLNLKPIVYWFPVIIQFNFNKVLQRVYFFRTNNVLINLYLEQDQRNENRWYHIDSPTHIIYCPDYKLLMRVYIREGIFFEKVFIYSTLIWLMEPFLTNWCFLENHLFALNISHTII